jgi:hypothetical protein
VYLVGTTGHPNYGDELIALAWVNHYARRFPEAEIWLDSPRPGQSAILMRRAEARVQCTDTLYHACWNAPSDKPGDVLAFGRRVVAEPGLLPREVSGMRMLDAASIIHIIGGGYVNALWPRHLALLSAAAAVSRRSGAALAVTGAGLVPCPDGGEALIAEVLSSFDVVDVRDEQSAAMLAPHLGSVVPTSDDVFVGLKSLPTAPGWDGATIVCVQNDVVDIDRDRLLTYVSTCVRDWGRSDGPLAMIECLPPGDLFGWTELQQHFPQLEIVPFDRLWSQGFPVGTNVAWLTTRYHPHLLAAAHGAGGAAILTGVEYYEIKHASLAALGSPFRLVSDLKEPPSLPSSPPAFSGRLEEILLSKSRVGARVLELVSRA